MPRFSRITKMLITRTVETDNLDDALFAFQNAIGITCGGIASQVFSDGWDEEWPKAAETRRREMLNYYIVRERGY